MKRFVYLTFLLALFASFSAAQSQDSAQSSRGEVIMKAISLAYPGRAGQAEFRNGDWAVQVNGEWFYYAEGRLLPEHLKERAAEYSPS